MSNEKVKKTIASRGIPSKESFYLPAHYSSEIRKFQDDGENVLRNYWNLEEVLNFVFPHKYQPVYNEISVKFMTELVKKNKLGAKDLTEFVKSNEISKATFYNRVLPRLKRVGMIKVERQTLIAEHNKQKFRPMEISLSKSFGNYLTKIGDSWLALVDDARTRKK
jgi:predicted transcriptional regulator